MRALLIIIPLIFIQSVAFGQRIGFDEIDDSKVKPWVPKLEIEYQATYHFGDSEMESEMIIIIGPKKIYAQIKSGSWSNNGKDWVWQYENLTGVRIDGNKFYSNKTNGEFVVYEWRKSNCERTKGIQFLEWVNNRWGI